MRDTEIKLASVAFVLTLFAFAWGSLLIGAVAVGGSTRSGPRRQGAPSGAESREARLSNDSRMETKGGEV